MKLSGKEPFCTLNKGNNKTKQCGMTLIEIMIAMLIGVFLSAGVFQIFLSTRQSYTMQENLSRIQEYMRFSGEFITSDMRQTGYQGCRPLKVTADTPTLKAPAPSPATMVGLSPTTAITGSEWKIATSTRSPAVNTNLTNLVDGTDVVTIAFGQSCGGFLTTTMAANTAATDIQITAGNTCSIESGNALIISDCGKSDIIRATANTTNTLIKHAAQDLTKAYAKGAEVMVYHEYSYYIRNGASGLPALWRRDNAADSSSVNPAEFIEGVENLQVTYGVETDAEGTANYGAPNYYVPADSVTDMGKVVSVKVSLLMASLDNGLASAPVPYTYNESLTTPPTGDLRIRRVMDSVIAIRNRIN